MVDRGSYVAASGGVFQFWRMEVVNNNLANINTVGYKRQVLVGEQEAFESTLASQLQADPYAATDHEQSPPVSNIRSYIDFSPGSIQTTERPLDVALKDPRDFFVIDTPDGEQYTRAGHFTLNSNGQMVTPDGHLVQGDGGSITIGSNPVNISNTGLVKSGEAIVGQIRVVRFNDTSGLKQVEGTRFTNDGLTAAENVDVADMIPNALEMSNMSVVEGMIEMISANRAFGQYAKSQQTLDEMNQQAIREIGDNR